jgi:hypothetical protein
MDWQELVKSFLARQDFKDPAEITAAVKLLDAFVQYCEEKTS